MKKISLLCLLLGAPAWAAHFDPPDLNFELELHRQHLRSVGLLEVQKRSRDGITESYKIQGGDTLWSLSQMLYGDGHFWPKVWAQNQDISNPHLIRPGHTLQFLMGSEDDTPAFRFSEEDEEPGLELVAGMSSPMIEIPPSDELPKPVAPIPKSFPNYQMVYTGGYANVVDNTVRIKKAEKVPDRLFLSAFVQETELESIGSYDDSDGEYGLPVVNQHVYLKLLRGRVKVGEKLQIVKYTGDIRKVNDQWNEDRDLDIHHIQVSGEVEVTERMEPDEDDPEHYEIVRALITKTIGLSLKDHQVIPGSVPMIDMGYDGRPGTASAQIIGSERHKASLLYGPGDIVFLDKGRSDGVSVGNILEIYSDRTIRDPNAQIRFSPKASGKVKVVKVTNRLSTAVVLESHDGLMQGDSVQQSKNVIVEEEDDLYEDDDSIEDSEDEIDGSLSDTEEDLEVESESSEDSSEL